VLASLGTRATCEASEPTHGRIQGTNGGVLALFLWRERAGFALSEQQFESLLQALAGSQHQRGVFDVKSQHRG